MLLSNPIVIDELLTKLFGPEYVSWENETLEIELIKLKHPVLSRYGKDSVITNMIDAMRAVKSSDSYVCEEWHLLEKTMTALTGKPVLFFECQPVSSLHELFLAIEIIKGLKTEIALSDETKFYIGGLLFGMGVSYFPFEPYNSCCDVFLANVSHDTTIVNDFKSKLNGFMAKPEIVIKMMEEIQANPDTDLLKNLKSVSLTNAITAVCSYLFVRGSLESHESAAEGLANDSLVDTNMPESTPETNAPSATDSEGIDSVFADNINRVLESDSKKELTEKNAAARNNKLPISGTYLIDKEPDEFDNNHTYEGSNAIPGESTASGVDLSNEDDLVFHGSSKMTKGLDTRKALSKNREVQDAINALFADLDI